VYQEQSGYLNPQTGHSQVTRAFTAFNHWHMWKKIYTKPTIRI
jgi:hypothetical protein